MSGRLLPDVLSCTDTRSAFVVQNNSECSYDLSIYPSDLPQGGAIRGVALQ